MATSWSSTGWWPSEIDQRGVRSIDLIINVLIDEPVFVNSYDRFQIKAVFCGVRSGQRHHVSKRSSYHALVQLEHTLWTPVIIYGLVWPPETREACVLSIWLSIFWSTNPCLSIPERFQKLFSAVSAPDSAIMSCLPRPRARAPMYTCRPEHAWV
jgi:hypothetical protein